MMEEDSLILDFPIFCILKKWSISVLLKESWPRPTFFATSLHYTLCAFFNSIINIFKMCIRPTVATQKTWKMHDVDVNCYVCHVCTHLSMPCLRSYCTYCAALLPKAT
jgi:hypothetical protein